MADVIPVDLPSLDQPFSWATRAGGVVCTAHGPVRGDGTIETGDVEAQATLTFDNLRRAIASADLTLNDVAQVLIYLTEVADMRTVDAVYRTFFDAPYPNRSTVVVKALVVPGMRIEIVAYAAPSAT
ncbi:RidA family protein [Pandoraea cepalis]|uniref:RidA family protein n=1 Tax=Pandoraea cepalis TaxID=2508294 RepID=A0AAW7MPQ0_9BURK|nr:RidA family protein [Pandoraea cepalis]MDN4574772.1 RidA family protein [Pandoraea cepalis]MDN4580275.1 RidA family protein [Pandoraea cepalis]